jgi:hemolysin III
MRCCTCAVPWRSLTHLRHEHLQPLSHARNVLFEGVQYAGWRGLHYPNGEPKSIMRGVLHEVAFCLSVVYMCVLFSLVHSTTGWIAAVVHVAAKLLLYGTSSQFHRRSWLLPAYNRLKRADHSAIFILAAGSSTPGGLLLLRSDPSLGSGLFEAGIVLLCWAWSTALLGVAHSLTKRLSGRVSPFGLIWMGVSGACMFPFVYQLWQAMLPYEFAALIIAWMLYLLAVLTYSRSWFNWWPNVFSYHEFFHLFTIFGAAFTGTFNFSICLRLT